LESSGEARDCKTDNVSMQQLCYLTTLQDSNFIPGGSTISALRLRTIRRPRGTTGNASTNSIDDPGELFFAFPSASLSARGLPLSVVSLSGRASAA
jgi:hypothetical protein